MFTFNHFNFNVLDLAKSMEFYEKALGFKEVRRKEAEDGSWILVYLGDGKMCIRDRRNNVNRKVNCETANLNKTVNAAVRQIEDIELILKRMDLSQLPQSLSDIASLRMEFPDASLKELGQMLNPPVGKSGINHRLRKLADIADSLREEMGEEIGTQNNKG